MQEIEEFRYLVLAAQREGARAFAALLEPLGLTPSQAEVLAVLRDAGRSLSVRAVGDLLVCERGSPSRLINSMAADGLLEVSRDPTDGRVSLLSLTRTGRRLAGRVASAEQQLHDNLSSQVAPADLTRSLAALRAVVAGTASGDAVTRRAANTA